MPFKSKAQRRACWAQYNKDIAAGKKPRWDCKEWEAATSGDLPEKVSAKMPSENAIHLAKLDLQKYTKAELDSLAKYYNINSNLDKQDLCWIIAIHNFLGH